MGVNGLHKWNRLNNKSGKIIFFVPLIFLIFCRGMMLLGYDVEWFVEWFDNEFSLWVFTFKVLFWVGFMLFACKRQVGGVDV